MKLKISILLPPDGDLDWDDLEEVFLDLRDSDAESADLLPGDFDGVRLFVGEDDDLGWKGISSAFNCWICIFGGRLRLRHRLG